MLRSLESLVESNLLPSAGGWGELLFTDIVDLAPDRIGVGIVVRESRLAGDCIAGYNIEAMGVKRSLMVVEAKGSELRLKVVYLTC